MELLSIRNRERHRTGHAGAALERQNLKGGNASRPKQLLKCRSPDLTLATQINMSKLNRCVPPHSGHHCGEHMFSRKHGSTPMPAGRDRQFELDNTLAEAFQSITISTLRTLPSTRTANTHPLENTRTKNKVRFANGCSSRANAPRRVHQVLHPHLPLPPTRRQARGVCRQLHPACALSAWSAC